MRADCSFAQLLARIDRTRGAQLGASSPRIAEFEATRCYAPAGLFDRHGERKLLPTSQQCDGE
jgi:hypothetical protein